MSQTESTWQTTMTSVTGRALTPEVEAALKAHIREECPGATLSNVKNAILSLAKITIPHNGFRTIDGVMICAEIKAIREREGKFNEATAEIERLKKDFEQAADDAARWEVVCSARTPELSQAMMDYAKRKGFHLEAVRDQMRLETAKLMGVAFKNPEVAQEDVDKQCKTCVSFQPSIKPQFGKCGNGWVGLSVKQVHKDSWIKALFTKQDSETMVGEEFGCRYYRRKG